MGQQSSAHPFCSNEWQEHPKEEYQQQGISGKNILTAGEQSYSTEVQKEHT